MTSWVRLWHDMPTDPKWRTIARKAGQPLPSVIALFSLMMINASSNTDDRGCLLNWDDEDAATALDIDTAAVVAIMSAMQGKVIENNRLTGWEKRQPKREDLGAASRKRSQRERDKDECHAASHNVTQRHAPDTDTDTDTDKNNTAGKAASGRKLPVVRPDDVPPNVWRDFLQVRKAKRAPMTDTALQAIRREAEKAGWGLGDALAECVTRGWQGFKSDWVKAEQSKSDPMANFIA